MTPSADDEIAVASEASRKKNAAVANEATSRNKHVASEASRRKITAVASKASSRRNQACERSERKITYIASEASRRQKNSRWEKSEQQKKSSMRGSEASFMLLPSVSSSVKG